MDRNVGIFLKETFWKSQKFDNLFWALLGEKNFPPPEITQKMGEIRNREFGEKTEKSSKK